MLFHNHDWEEIDFKKEENRFGLPYVTINYKCKKCNQLGHRLLANVLTSIEENEERK